MPRLLVTIISISFPVTLCATKDPWPTVWLKEQTTFRQQIKEDKKKRNESKPFCEITIVPWPLIENSERALTKQPAENNFNGFVVLPYVQGVSEKIGRILKQQKVKVAYKPQQIINSLFLHPIQERDNSDRQKTGILYKINCTQCNFVHYGQAEKSLKTQIAEHKKAVASFDQNSDKVASHVHQFSHNMNFVSVKVVGFESNYHERLFLWTQTLETITSYFQKPTKASREHEWSGVQASCYITLNSLW